MTMPSARSNFSLTISYNSSLNTHLPSAMHRLQAMQPCTAFVPIDTISVSIPFVSSAFATSDKAMNVFPSPRGLPLINNTFIKYPPYFYLGKSNVKAPQQHCRKAQYALLESSMPCHQGRGSSESATSIHSKSLSIRVRSVILLCNPRRYSGIKRTRTSVIISALSSSGVSVPFFFVWHFK